MAWEEQHKLRIAMFPEDVREAHTHSSQHRREIEASGSCGCFYCCSIYPPLSIEEWVDEDDNDVGQTALCPRCGIDSVIGSQSGFRIDKAFLEKMKQYWF